MERGTRDKRRFPVQSGPVGSMRQRQAVIRVHKIKNNRGLQYSIPTTSLLTFMLSIVVVASAEPCPWSTLSEFASLESSCLCAYNAEKEVSVQCNFADFDAVVAALRRTSAGESGSRRPPTTVVDLLYLNNASVGLLEDGAFRGIKIRNLQLSNCAINAVSASAFDGLEDTLKNLNLQVKIRRIVFLWNIFFSPPIKASRAKCHITEE